MQGEGAGRWSLGPEVAGGQESQGRGAQAELGKGPSRSQPQPHTGRQSRSGMGPYRKDVPSSIHTRQH